MEAAEITRGALLVLRLGTFGDPRLADEAGNTIPCPEKALLLLAFLATCPGQRLSRQESANFLWGENDGANAQVNLRQLLSRVKARQTELGLVVFELLDSAVALRSGSVLVDFRDTWAGPDQALPGALRSILDNVNGAFFGGLDFASERSQIWVEAERARMIGLIEARLESAIAKAADVGSHGALIKDAAYRLLQLDAYNEVAYRVLMKVFASDGHLAQAKAAFAKHKERLWRDLGVAPDLETMNLVRALFNARGNDRAAEPIAKKPDAERSGDAPSTQVKLPRLVLMPPADAEANSLAGMLATSLLEDITIGLCRSKTLSIVAPHTASRIPADLAARTAAFQQHAISYAMETRLRQAGGEVSLFASLVHLVADEVIWAERFDLTPTSLPASYNSIVRKIVVAVADQIERVEFARLGCERNPDAYQHYLMGQHSLRTIDLPFLRRARKSFRAALQEAPLFGAAFSGLSRTEHLEWLLTARGDGELLKSAEQHALKAIEVDGDSAGGYRELGVTKLYQGAFDESIEAFEGAEQSAPGHADLLADYADTLVHASEPERGLEKIERAMQLNPLCPDVYLWTAAGAHYFVGHYETALDCLSRVAEQSHVSRFAAACWGMLGDRRKARSFMRKTLAVHPDFEIEKWMSIVPTREEWQKDLYREGLRKAGFK